MTDVSPLQSAQQSYVDAIPKGTLEGEDCPLQQASGHTLAEDIIAPEDAPPYHRAIVEGFLVRAADTRAASEEEPVSFRIVGDIQPGDSHCPDIGAFEAMRIVTGSIVGDGELTAVRQWEAEEDGDSFTIKRPFPPRFFIEDRGCDHTRGSVVIAAGTLLGPADIGTIASLGISTVKVARHPRVTIFSSGDEVIPYTSAVTPGQIRDSNSVMLAAAVREAGGTSEFGGIMNDDFDAFVSAARAALADSDMLLISGGTAVGGRDFIADLVKALGELLIDGVPMRSGRPLIMGKAGDKPIICVAGHPPEALRGFRLFGVPAMQRMLGQDVGLPDDA